MIATWTVGLNVDFELFRTISIFKLFPLNYTSCSVFYVRDACIRHSSFCWTVFRWVSSTARSYVPRGRTSAVRQIQTRPSRSVWWALKSASDRQRHRA